MVVIASRKNTESFSERPNKNTKIYNERIEEYRFIPELRWYCLYS
ncbi:hypothetical protein FHS60_000851 [Alloprevotella rava]|uniref:Uncharacterized protein n=1 Tax=Alloprevotella rava TaxID=671218 RepID=A0A7W5UE43_9BACT|nr:hypothetical protein [Alloprevotella rava]